MTKPIEPTATETPAGAAPAPADGGAPAAPEPASQAGAAVPPPAEPPPSNPPPPAGEHRCEKCGKGFPTKSGMHGHRRWCLRKADPPARRKISTAADAAADAEPAPAERPASVEDAVKAAAAALDGVDGDATTAEVLGKLSHGGIGVAELIALACYRALPPPLTDPEYQALRGVWSESQIELPQWAMQLLVTLAIIGPRAMAHPWLGPQIRALFVPSKPAAAAVAPPRRQDPPPPPPPPEPEPAPSKPAAPARSAADLTDAEKAAWDV